MARRTSRSDRFRIPGRPAPEVPAVTTMLVCQPCFPKIVAIEVGVWKTNLALELYRPMLLRFRDGSEATVAARFPFTVAARKALMESVGSGDPSLGRAFMDKRSWAMERILGALQRKYGAIPQVTHVVAESAAA